VRYPSINLIVFIVQFKVAETVQWTRYIEFN